MLPRFLGIGAQKCGTSWLHVNLRQHPEVWLPPKKEIHFFDTRDLSWAEQRRHYSVQRPLGMYLRGGLLKDLRKGRVGRVLWHLNYYYRPRTERWYRSLFPDADGLASGDVTPVYGMLSEDKIRRVAKLVPDVRLIFLMREPVSRAWSELRMAHRLGVLGFADRSWASVEDVPFDVWKRVAESDSVVRSSDYAGQLRRWAAHFPRDQLFVGFLDEIEAHPSAFLDRVCRFLGIRSDVEWPEADRARHKGRSAPMPEALAAWLREIEASRLVELRRVLGDLGVSEVPGWVRETSAESEAAVPVLRRPED